MFTDKSDSANQLKSFITLIKKKLNTAAEPKAKNAVGVYARVSVCVSLLLLMEILKK